MLFKPAFQIILLYFLIIFSIKAKKQINQFILGFAISRKLSVFKKFLSVFSQLSENLDFQFFQY